MGRFLRPVLLCLFTLCLLLLHVWSEDKVQIKTENGVLVIINPEEPGAAPKVWKKNKLYTIEEDEEGYQYVVRYKVAWE